MNLTSRLKNLKSLASKTSKSQFSRQSYVFFNQNLDFVLGLSRKSKLKARRFWPTRTKCKIAFMMNSTEPANAFWQITSARTRVTATRVDEKIGEQHVRVILCEMRLKILYYKIQIQNFSSFFLLLGSIFFLSTNQKKSKFCFLR